MRAARRGWPAVHSAVEVSRPTDYRSRLAADAHILAASAVALDACGEVSHAAIGSKSKDALHATLSSGQPVTTGASQEKVMQICDLSSSHRSSGPAPDAALSEFSPDRPRGARLLTNARTDASGFAVYLHEELAQTLCAVKLQLERLAQNELHDASLASSIALLQGAIRHVCSLAEEVRPAHPPRGSTLPMSPRVSTSGARRSPRRATMRAEPHCMQARDR